MNWIKTHRRHCAAIIGAGMIVAGILALIPRSPWSLIVIGGFVLFCALVSLAPKDMPPR